MGRYTLLILNGAILTGCAVFIYDARTILLTGLMLFLPLLDRKWKFPALSITQAPLWLWLAIASTYLVISGLHPDHAKQALMIVLFTALPEEWFFRAYVLATTADILKNKTVRLTPYKTMWLSNLITSSFFSLIHTPTQGLLGLAVFFPSMLFGWLYQTYRNILLVILLHALSNLLFVLYVRDLLHATRLFK